MDPTYDFEFLSWKGVRDMEFPPDQWKIHGLVPKHGLTFLAGVSGEKKTWLGLHMAFCIATGTHLFGNDKFPTAPGKVLYLDSEMGKRELNRRGKLLNFDLIPEENFVFLSEQVIDIKDDLAFELLSDEIELQGVDVIFVDTLRGVAGGLNEDKAEDVRAFLQRFNYLKNKGIAVIVLDHCRKPLRNEGYAPKKEQILGSQDKVASAESVIMIKSEPNSPGFAVYQVKSRTGMEIKPFLAQMIQKEGEKFIEFKFDGEYDEQVSKMDTAKLVLPQVIGIGSKTTKELISIMSQEHKIQERYVREALRSLSGDDTLVIEKVGREHSYRNTASGLLLSNKV